MLERKLLYVLTAVQWVFTDGAFWKEFSLRINLSISWTETRNVQFFHLCLFNKIYKVGSLFKVWLL